MHIETTPTRLIAPLTAETLEAMRSEMSAAKAQGADLAECRLDYLDHLPGEDELQGLLTATPLPLIVTCRPVRQGGRYNGDESLRIELLRRASEFGTVVFVDFENDVDIWDLVPDRTLLSVHDFDRCPPNLDALAERLRRRQTVSSKIAFMARGAVDALRALDVLHEQDWNHSASICLAMGEHGLPSRILARKFNAFGTFASLGDEQSTAPGQPTLHDLRELYQWERINPESKVFGVIGCPIAHSMSPAIHNAAFAAADVDGVYVPFRVEPGREPFTAFLDACRQRPWLDVQGLSVTIPHKQNALEYIGAAHCDELAVKIGAVNTITFEPDGTLHGDNTDYAGAIDALCEAMHIGRDDLAGRTAAVLGAGGASRAIVAALVHYGAEVVIFNRTVARAETLAEEFGCQAGPLSEAEHTGADILINCTSLGMHPNIDISPLETLPEGVEVVFDTVYNPLRTRLIESAEDAGKTVVSGLEMFVNQAAAQFQRWTGQAPPSKVMRDVVLRRLTVEQ
jgi:3-dehydroquinate dehydratase/shikimate dehydrogenase